jgi:hypothetical protein
MSWRAGQLKFTRTKSKGAYRSLPATGHVDLLCICSGIHEHDLGRVVRRERVHGSSD